MPKKKKKVTWCFTPGQPVRLYQEEEEEEEEAEEEEEDSDLRVAILDICLKVFVCRQAASSTPSG